MEEKKEIEVRELAEKFFNEAVNQLDDPERKEEVELEKETYIGVWMLGYRAGESGSPAAAREEDAVEFAEWAGWDWRRVEGKNMWENQKTLEVLKTSKLYERYKQEYKATGKE